LAAVHQEVVGEGMPEPVRVQVIDAGLGAADVHPLSGAVRGQRAALGQEQRIEVRPPLRLADP